MGVLKVGNTKRSCTVRKNAKEGKFWLTYILKQL